MPSIMFPISRIEFSETAVRKGIDNRVPAELAQNAERLSQFLGLLNQAVRDRYGLSMTTTSIYRCPTLNAEVGGSANSDHMRACAADTQVVHVRPFDLAIFYQSWLKAMKVDFEQVIVEFGAWAHIAIPESGKIGRKQFLTAVKTRTPEGKTKVEYLVGLQDKS